MSKILLFLQKKNRKRKHQTHESLAVINGKKECISLTSPWTLRCTRKHWHANCCVFFSLLHLSSPVHCFVVVLWKAFSLSEDVTSREFNVHTFFRDLHREFALNCKNDYSVRVFFSLIRKCKTWSFHGRNNLTDTAQTSNIFRWAE